MLPDTYIEQIATFDQNYANMKSMVGNTATEIITLTDQEQEYFLRDQTIVNHFGTKHYIIFCLN